MLLSAQKALFVVESALANVNELLNSSHKMIKEIEEVREFERKLKMTF